MNRRRWLRVGSQLIGFWLAFVLGGIWMWVTMAALAPEPTGSLTLAFTSLLARFVAFYGIGGAIFATVGMELVRWRHHQQGRVAT